MKRNLPVSSSDVAREAGVSRTTVSYVLNDVPGASVPLKTRQHVLEVANRLGYRVNSLAQGLKAGRTSLIGVFCRKGDDAFHDRISHGIYEECFDHGYNVMMAYISASGIPDESLSRMRDYLVSGIIRMAYSPVLKGDAERLTQAAGGYDIPCVVVDDATDSDIADCVVSDDLSGTTAAMSHLISQGHRRIGYISGGKRSSNAVARWSGYEAGLVAAGILIDPELVCGESFQVEDHVAAIRNVFALKNRPTALLCVSDTAAAIARELAREQGIRVPEDLALVGFGNTELAQYGGLTTVDQNPREMGRAAVRRLLERIKNPDVPPATIVVPTGLIVRGSTTGNPYAPYGIDMG